MRKKLKKCMNCILISVLSISCWEVGKKQVNYIESSVTYNTVQSEKDKFDNINEYLDNKDYNWITVTETAIDYPLMLGSDNQYYLNHDYSGRYDIAGSIYYDATDRPYNGLLTVVYGHSMRNGTMFNNLHYFPQDIERFNKSKLTIYDKESEKVYAPLAYTVFPASEPFYRKIDSMSTNEAVTYLKVHCDYSVENPKYNENSHIIALITCDYSVKDGRLVVFYISE